MRRLSKIYIVLVVIVVSLVGCQRSFQVDDTQGNVSIILATSSESVVVEKSTKSGVVQPLPSYTLTILNSKGEEVAKYGEDELLSAIRLDAGRYKFVASSGSDNEEPLLNAPYYYGEEEVTVVAGEMCEVHIIAKLANVRISADFSQVIKDPSLITSYSFSVGEAVLDGAEIDAGSSIYLGSSTTEFDWVVDVVNVQGTASKLYQTQRGVVPSSHYKYFFDVDLSTGELDGDMSINLQIDQYLDVNQDSIEINLEKKAPPVLTTVGFSSGVQKIVKDVSLRDAEAEFQFEVYALTKEVIVRHTNDELYSAGVPYTMELTTLTQATKSAANSAGIEWTTPLYDSPESNVSFTKFAEKAPLGEYTFYVSLIDKDDQIVEGTLSFAVLPEMDHITGDAEYGAKYAVLYGQWYTLERPAGLSFQYRESGSEEWILVDTLLVETISEEAKTFKTRITGLKPLTTYQYRTYTPEVQYDDRIQSFTTYDAPEIPNLNFEQGYWDGNYWYPNASGGNSYWATGNEGIVASPVSQNSNTYHTDDAVSGKAVYMESVRINLGISPVKFAAGNIFTGSYSTNMTDPKASVKFGRPYRGRPLKLVGWYKYLPQNINNDKDGVAGNQWGQPDHCHIYISLEDWGSESATTRPSNPRIIGYGEFKSNQNVGSYSRFEIVINYYEDRVPTHVSLAATSSHLGGDFCGGDGSKLYIDEFELVWE